jgi:hypothetical protein
MPEPAGKRTVHALSNAFAVFLIAVALPTRGEHDAPRRELCMREVLVSRKVELVDPLPEMDDPAIRQLLNQQNGADEIGFFDAGGSLRSGATREEHHPQK